MKLVIVESPAKARTLGKILGPGYVVRASMGHVRDLPVSEFGVDVRRGFQPRYVVVRGKARTLQELKEHARRASGVLLATDPDREGEAISWHLAELLDIPAGSPCRIEFHEVTRRAVEEAVRRPRPIDQRLVDAQVARRILDRIVGYRLSPLLWRKVRRGLSAGRVQSVALRLICERDREIEEFRPREYWTIDVLLTPDPGADGASDRSFAARLSAVAGQEPDLPDEAAARAVADALETQVFRVASVTAQRRHRRPPAPFTTSTLQQEASRRLGMTARRTMAVAQQLYEGLELGDEGPVGLITYMRTDSVRVAPEAQEASRAFIRARFGEAFLPEAPPRHRGQKGAQEAHEAIRPTSVERTPESVRPRLNRDQGRLYELIWRRFVASQMAPALVHTVTVRIEAGPYELKASGSTVEAPGYLACWPPPRQADAVRLTGGEGNAASAPTDEEEAGADSRLPPLQEGQLLQAVQVRPEQHFTQPPPRYNDASLVKAMEELGIGRPSTYAPTIETLLERGYCQRQGRQLVSTSLGRAVLQLLKEQFPDIIDVGFTAQMEAGLDEIEEGRAAWRELVAGFYSPFEKRVEQAMQQAGRVTVQEATDEVCERCGRPMVVKWGRYGRFLACSGYPQCRHTRPLLEKVGASCPRCGGQLVARRTRRGRTFYGCEGYPACSYVLWRRPVGRACPRCGRPLVVRRVRGGAEEVVCAGLLEKDTGGASPACSYSETGGGRPGVASGAEAALSPGGADGGPVEG